MREIARDIVSQLVKGNCFCREAAGKASSKYLPESVQNKRRVCYGCRVCPFFCVNDQGFLVLGLGMECRGRG